MDKKTKEAGADKKNENGDFRKFHIKSNREFFVMKDSQPEQGDSGQQITNHKSKPNIEKQKPEVFKRYSDSRDLNKRDGTIQNRTYLDSEKRKLLRERYTLRLRNSQNLIKNSEVKDITKENNKSEKKPDDEPVAKDKSKESSKNSVQTEPRTENKQVKEPLCQRKPIVKTVTVKNDSRVYKAVTFVDHKQHMPLRINIPNEHKKKGNIIETDKDPLKINLNSSNELSKKRVKRRDKKRGETFAEFSVKDEDAFLKKRGKKRRVTSPVLPVKGASPPTEVAKWAPSCISHHTKPYYEAWVDTTLAAISSGSNRDKLFFDKQRFIQSFQRALYERTELPDLTYENCNDERYTGRIKVSQR